MDMSTVFAKILLRALDIFPALEDFPQIFNCNADDQQDAIGGAAHKAGYTQEVESGIQHLNAEHR